MATVGHGTRDRVATEVVRGINARADEIEIRCPVDARKYDGPSYPVVPIPGFYDVDR